MYLLGILGRRVLQIVPTVLLVAVLMFALMRLLPGDPAQVMLGDRATTPPSRNCIMTSGSTGRSRCSSGSSSCGSRR